MGIHKRLRARSHSKNREPNHTNSHEADKIRPRGWSRQQWKNHVKEVLRILGMLNKE